MKKIIYSILILVFLGIVLSFLAGNKAKEATNEPIATESQKYVTYKSSEYSPEFTYPEAWGEVTTRTGNKACPEEDTYRTPDTLHIFDWEYAFPEIKLPGSDSIIRTGIRTYELDPKKPNDCGDDFHLKIGSGEVDPETISSFRLNSAAIKSGLAGTFNAEASRLNTEARMQYTFFVAQQDSKIFILQPYISFIPYFDSPELRELDTKFGGDMAKYLREGKTAQNIRWHFNEFIKTAESLKFTGE